METRNPRSENRLTYPGAAWSHNLAHSNAMPCPSGLTPLREGTNVMTTQTYATQANAPAGVARARVANGSCPAASAPWSHLFIGTTMHAKHGRPRRTPVSPT